MGKLAFGRAEKGGACPPLSRALFKKLSRGIIAVLVYFISCSFIFETYLLWICWKSV